MQHTKWKPTPNPWKVSPVPVGCDDTVPRTDPNHNNYRGLYALQYDNEDYEESSFQAFANSRVISAVLDGVELAEMILEIGTHPGHTRYHRFPKSIVEKARAVVQHARGVLQHIPSKNPGSDAQFAVTSWKKQGRWALWERLADGSFVVRREGGHDTRYFQKPSSEGTNGGT